MKRWILAPARLARGLWLWVGIALAVTVCGTLSLPTLALTGDGRLGHRIFARRWGRFILWWCGVRLRVQGLEGLSLDRPMVIVANHVSHFGFYAIAATFPVQWRAVMRREMRRIPIFGYVGEKAGHVFIRLGNRDQARADMQRGIERLRKGCWLLVFPEGRPGSAPGPLPFRKGAFHLALEARADVLPVALEEIYPRGVRPGWSAAPSEVRVRIGRAIETSALSRADADALAGRARSEIAAHLAGA